MFPEHSERREFKKIRGKSGKMCDAEILIHSTYEEVTKVTTISGLPPKLWISCISVYTNSLTKKKQSILNFTFHYNSTSTCAGYLVPG